jgi:hypothetical protein
MAVDIIKSINGITILFTDLEAHSLPNFGIPFRTIYSTSEWVLLKETGFIVVHIYLFATLFHSHRSMLTVTHFFSTLSPAELRGYLMKLWVYYFILYYSYYRWFDHSCDLIFTNICLFTWLSCNCSCGQKLLTILTSIIFI